MTRREESQKHAIAAIKHVRAALPFGSDNRKYDHKNLEAMKRIDLAQKEVAVLPNNLLNTAKIAEIFQNQQAGNCQAQCSCAFAFLSGQTGVSIQLCTIEKLNHVFLIINDDLICDPWLPCIHSLDDFQEYMKMVLDCMPNKSVEGIERGISKNPGFSAEDIIIMDSVPISTGASLQKLKKTISGKLQGFFVRKPTLSGCELPPDAVTVNGFTVCNVINQ